MDLCIKNSYCIYQDNANSYKTFRNYDLSLVELNPLKLKDDLYSLDGEELSKLKNKLLDKNIIPLCLEYVSKNDFCIFKNKTYRNLLSEHMKSTILICSLLGIPSLNFNCLNDEFHENFDSKLAYEITTEFFHDLGEFCKDKNVFITLSPSSNSHNGILSSNLKCLNMVREINSKSIKLSLTNEILLENTSTFKNIILDSLNHLYNIYILEEFLFPFTKESKDNHTKLIEFMKKIKYRNLISIDFKTSSLVKEELNFFTNLI